MKKEFTLEEYLDFVFKGREVKPFACTTKFQETFYIEDIEKTGCVGKKKSETPHAEKYFLAENDHKKDIALFSIEPKFLQQEGGQCDFILYDDIYFCFGEMKTNSPTKNYLQIQHKRNEAVEQLRNTIRFFNKHLKKDYKKRKVEAYICTPSNYQEVYNKFPKFGTEIVAIQTDFKKEFDGIRLFESSKKTF